MQLPCIVRTKRISIEQNQESGTAMAGGWSRHPPTKGRIRNADYSGDRREGEKIWLLCFIARMAMLPRQITTQK